MISDWEYSRIPAIKSSKKNRWLSTNTRGRGDMQNLQQQVDRESVQFTFKAALSQLNSFDNFLNFFSESADFGIIAFN